MCGVLGCINTDKVEDFIVGGVRTLEYRGYDAFGWVVASENKFYSRRTKGPIKPHTKLLKDNFACEDEFKPTSGLGHTRWLCVGENAARNTHPISYKDERGAAWVVHNGIVETTEPLNFKRTGETDTENIAYLLHKYIFDVWGEGFYLSVLSKLKGDYAFLGMESNDPKTIYFAKTNRPLYVSHDGRYAASEITALQGYCDECFIIPDNCYGWMSHAACCKFTVLDMTEHQPIPLGNLKRVSVTTISPAQALRSNRMLEEIKEQATLDFDKIVVPEIPKPSRIRLFGCGSSWNAALLGAMIMERITDIPVDVDYSTILEGRLPQLAQLESNTLFVALTQSGETADTVRVIDKIRAIGPARPKVAVITNVKHSQAAQKSDYVIELNVGQEYAVAATKTVTAQILAMVRLAISFGDIPKRYLVKNVYSVGLKLFADEVNRLVECDKIKKLAETVSNYRNALYLGEGQLYPIAVEGALKLKEVCYIHAEGMVASQSKHGCAVSLVASSFSDLLCVAIATREEQRVLENIEQLHARGGKFLIICTDDIAERYSKYGDVISVKSTHHGYIDAMLINVVCQLLAHYVAEVKGIDSSKPKGLSKSVTV